jgi:hypothetical protein
MKDARWLGQRKNVAVVRQIAQEYGFAEALRAWKRSYAGGAIAQAHAVFTRAKERGRLPIRTLADYGNQEYRDAAWVNTKRSAKAGMGYVWYPVLDEIAAQYGFPDAFYRRQKRDVK